MRPGASPIVARMKRTLALALAAALGLSASACGKKEEKTDKPAEVTKPAEPPPPVAEPAKPAEPPKAVYSADAAKAAIAELGACSSQYNCAGYKTLVGFGPQAGPDLLAHAGDTTANPASRRLAANAIGELKVPDAGPKLVELGLASDDHMFQSDFFEAAGKTGGQATFDALIAAYEKASASLDDDREIPLRAGLRGFPAESVAWAKARLAKAKKDHTSYADLVTDSAQKTDLPTVVEMLNGTKDVMARNRLAAKAIELGDQAHFAVFVDGLKSKDQYDRSDTANFLADVAEHTPADLKPTLVELLQKGKAADAGGLTAMGYDKALKKLEAK